MKYVISDIHGCYRQYRNLIGKLKLSEEDQLYVLGDAVDRGPAPVKVLQDLMKRKNVTYLMGNHDLLFWYFLGKKGLDLSGRNLAECDPDELCDFRAWLEDGGITTAKQYIRLPQKERAAICAFLEQAKVYEVIKERGRIYVLAHAGIAGFKEEVPLKDYDFMDFVCTRTDYDRRYYQDPNTFVITGHTPTPCIRKDHLAEVYEGNGHIAVDCGCVYGGKLAAYCIETGEAIYVEGRL